MSRLGTRDDRASSDLTKGDSNFSTISGQQTRRDIKESFADGKRDWKKTSYAETGICALFRDEMTWRSSRWERLGGFCIAMGIGLEDLDVYLE